jgi:hypothetical protein
VSLGRRRRGGQRPHLIGRRSRIGDIQKINDLPVMWLKSWVPRQALDVVERVGIGEVFLCVGKHDVSIDMNREAHTMEHCLPPYRSSCPS